MMNNLDKRLRNGLTSEAEAWQYPKPTETSAATTTQGIATQGIMVALTAAAAVLIVVGGISLAWQSTGGTGLSGSAPIPDTQTTTPSTALSQTSSDGQFEAVPFSGETWQLSVGEGANPPTTTFKVCYRFDEPGVSTEASGIGPSGCGNWPTKDTSHLISVTRALETETGVVLLIDLTHNPVDTVRIVRESEANIDVSPFRMPGSGKQFAVVEMPDRDGTVTVDLIDASGVLVESSAPIRLGKPMWPEEAAAQIGAEPISNDELRRVLGETPFVQDSGYRIGQVGQDSPVTAELGVVLYAESGFDEDDPLFCLMDYAIVDGIVAAGGAVCAPTDTQVLEDISSGNLAIGISGSCGPIPKDSPNFLDGAWTLLSLWALPDQATSVDVSLGNGEEVSIPVSGEGTAQMLWHESVTITSVAYDGVTPRRADYASQLLPATGIDCTPDDGRNG
jgi:hypothetical protein